MLNAVLIDSREPKHIQNIKIGDIVPMIQMLPTGDAWLACHDTNIIVERKTPTDLLASIADGRIFEQCAKMAVASPWSYVIITGYLSVQDGQVVSNGQVTNWNARSVQGALLTIQELGIEIAYCDGDREFANTLEWLANRDRGEIKIKPQRRDAVMQSADESLLCALPGISDKRAADLLKFCGTAAWALSYLTDDDNPNSVPGVGPGTRKRARQALGLASNEFLAVLVNDGEDYVEKEKSDNE